MKKSRLTDEQIIGFLRQAEYAVAVKDLYRKYGFSDASFTNGAAGWLVPIAARGAYDRRRLENGLQIRTRRKSSGIERLMRTKRGHGSSSS